MITKKLNVTYEGILLEIEYFLRPGAETTLLYLHGGGCSKDDFIEAVQRKELTGYTLVGFDFPGCGNSPYPPQSRLNIDDLVEITQLVIENLRLNNIVLIGHSMGGLISLLLAERHPSRIQAFVSVEGNLSSDSCNFSRKIISFSLEEWEKVEFPKLIKTLTESGNKGHEEFAKTLEKHSSPRAFYDACHQIVDYSDNGDLARRFIELTIPRILLYGSENRSMRHIEELKRKGLGVYEIPNSNHFPFYDNPGEYYKVVVSFLEGLN